MSCYKRKKRQNQRKQVRADTADTGTSKEPQTEYSKAMRKCHESLSLTSGPGIATTRRAAQAMNNDTVNEECTQSQEEIEDKTSKYEPVM